MAKCNAETMKSTLRTALTPDTQTQFLNINEM